MRWFFLFLLLSVPVSAQLISDYPYFLFSGRDFNGLIIKGDIRESKEITASNLVINSLPKLYAPFFRIHDGFNFYRIRADEASVVSNVFIASEVSELNRPAVLIGTPCNNVWVQRVLNLNKCDVLPEDEGFVLITFYNYVPVIVISGGSPDAVFNAASWLHSDAHFRFFSKLVVLKKSIAKIPVNNGNFIGIGMPISESPVRIDGTYLTGGRVIFKP